MSAKQSTLINDDGSVIDQTIVDQALVWFTRYHSDANDAAAEQDLRNWRAAHPDHERAWQRLQTLSSNLHQGVQQAPGSVARDVVSKLNAQQKSRRGLLKLCAGLTVLGGSAALLSDQAQFRGLLAQHRTAAGERRQLILEDGTTLDLNTATAISIKISNAQRLITLHHGELHIQSAPTDPASTAVPYRVITEDGQVQPIGTRFSVRRYPEDQQTRVQVFAGEVAIINQNEQRLGAGRQLSFNQQRRFAETELTTGSDSWLQGRLSAQRMPLSQFLDELAHHRSGWIYYDDSIADLQVTGSFPLEDTDRILKALSDTLPIDISRRTNYWIQVSRRTIN